MVGAGHFLVRRLVPQPFAENASLRLAAAYFVGISAFLAVFLLASRAVGARASLGLVLALIAGASAWEFRWMLRRRTSLRFSLRVLAAVLALIAGYAVTNCALWLEWGRGSPIEPGLFTHF